MIYSVFVGKYSTPSVSKSDLRKLNELGLKGYLFVKNDFYTLKVHSTVNQSQAEFLRNKLTQQGFTSFIEEEKLKTK